MVQGFVTGIHQSNPQVRPTLLRPISVRASMPHEKLGMFRSYRQSRSGTNAQSDKIGVID